MDRSPTDESAAITDKADIVFRSGARGKDLAANGMVMGFASTAWFGWAHQADLAVLQVPLAVGMALGIAVGTGCLMMRRRLGGQSVHELEHRRANRVYGIAVGFELVASFLGALALGGNGYSQFTVAWIMVIMGVHFVPLSRLYRIPELTATGILCIAAGVAGAVTGLLTSLDPAAVAAGGGGVVLVATGILAGVRLRKAWPPTAAGVRTRVRTS